MLSPEKWAMRAIDVSVEDFATAVAIKMLQMQPKAEAPKVDEYLTVKEVSERFRVSIPTLHRWAKTGYLVPCEFGGKRLYKLSEIEKEISHG